MLSKYQISEEYIIDTINAFHNGNYINLIAMVQIFEVSVKTIY